MKNVLTDAKALAPELIQDRRAIHGFAEVGIDLPQTYAYVFEKLTGYGYQPQKVGKMGITCLVGKPGPALLLRADMDALPMAEESGEPFAAVNGNCHSCGHDCHTAMLLAAAKLLKEREGELKGTVKFMFQPAEELLSGANDMIDHGILENPKVDAALALHIMSGQEFSRSGGLFCVKGCVTNSGDALRIRVQGKDAHGSMPEKGVDAIHIAAHIVLALEELTAHELPMKQDSIVLVGRIEGGTSCNSVPGTAALEVSIRTDSTQHRNFLLKRVEEVAQSVAATFRGQAEVEAMYGGIPPLENDGALLEEMASYLEEILPGNVQAVEKLGGGEDFAMVAQRVPSVYFNLGVGSPQEGHENGLHHPKMRVDEEALPVGAAAYVQCALRWLEEHQK